MDLETNAAASQACWIFFAQVIDTYDSDNNKAVDLVYVNFQNHMTRYLMRDSWHRPMDMTSKVMQPDGQDLASWAPPKGLHQPNPQ